MRAGLNLQRVSAQPHTVRSGSRHPIFTSQATMLERIVMPLNIFEALRLQAPKVFPSSTATLMGSCLTFATSHWLASICRRYRRGPRENRLHTQGARYRPHSDGSIGLQY